MKSIMIIEDERDIRECLKDYLETEGFSVLAAENGKEALVQLRGLESLPNLIFLDLTMPIMGGLAFRQIQLGDPKLSSIPVVVSSADPNAEDKMKDCRISVFLKKPTDLDQVLEVARGFCA